MNGKRREHRTAEITIKTSLIHGKGVFTTKNYLPGSEVAYFEGYYTANDTYHSLTLDGRKVEPTGFLKYLNHSCDANSEFIGRKLTVKREVRSRQELTINYLDTENQITHRFECNCCCTDCSGLLRK